MESNDIIISVRELTKMFGDFTAVDHISFDVRKGEIFGFLGANRRRKDNSNAYALRSEYAHVG